MSETDYAKPITPAAASNRLFMNWSLTRRLQYMQKADHVTTPLNEILGRELTRFGRVWLRSENSYPVATESLEPVA